MIIVTGLPRSGTQWASWVLNELGVPAQHEGINWSPEYVPEIPDVPAVSSWALAVSPDLPQANVFSLRRGKDVWARSMVRSHVAEAWTNGAPWVDFARHNLGVSAEAWVEMTPQQRADVFYSDWPTPGELLRPGTKKAVYAMARAAGVSVDADVVTRLAEHVVDPTVR